MTKFQLDSPSGGPLDYPALGFSAVDGAILDGAASTPAITSVPDGNWSVYGGASVETGINRYAPPATLPTYTEPTDGYLLTYSDTDNAGTWQDPTDALSPVADAIIAGRINTPESATDEALGAAFLRGLNVKSKGATGDGTTNDTAAIQVALDAVSPALGAMTVVIPSGTYMINGVNLSPPAELGPQTRNQWAGGGIKPESGTTLLLAPDAILKVITNSSPGYSCIYLGYGQDNITIRGGQILGDRATHNYATEPTYTSHEWGFGIAVRGAQDVVIERVKISGCTGDAVFVCSKGLIGIDAFYYPSTRIVVRGCNLSGSRRNNISTTACDQVLIEGCTIADAGINDGVHDGAIPRFGIDIEGYGEGSIDYETPLNVTVRGNKFSGNVNGAVMNFNGYGVVIEKNFADGPISYGAGTKTLIDGNIVVNLADTTRTGITSNSGIPYDSNAVITNNIVLGFKQGIMASGVGVVVSDNFVSAFVDNGIEVYLATDATVSGNRIANGSGAAAVGVRVNNSTGVLVTNNKVRNTRTGYATITTATGVNFISNEVTKGVQAFNIGAGCQAVIKGNISDLPGHASTQSYDCTWTTTSNVVCEDNTFRNSTSYSINASSGGTGGVSKILNNKVIESTSATAFSLSAGTHEIVGNLLTVNKASGSSAAIIVVGASVNSRVVGNTAYHTGASAYTSLVNSSTATGTPATRVAGNYFAGTTMTVAHASDIIGENFLIGFINKAKNTGTILDTTSSLVVTHGLHTTPTVVTVTPRGNEAIWVSARTTTTFTVSRVGTTGALAFDWRADV